jgi:futalosine hydrolase
VNILLLSATEPEVAPLIGGLGVCTYADGRFRSFANGMLKTDVLISGIGMVAKAYWLGKYLSAKKYDLVLNLGIAGSFSSEISIGEVVNVTTDQFSEVGAITSNGFLTSIDLQFSDFDSFPFQAGLLVNPMPFDKFGLQNLKQVSGITVNTIHGEVFSISSVVKQFHPDVETMGGAAFFYGCLIENVPCAQIRSISNYVEERDKPRWNISLAVKNLTSVALGILDYLNNKNIANE